MSEFENNLSQIVSKLLSILILICIKLIRIHLNFLDEKFMDFILSKNGSQINFFVV